MPSARLAALIAVLLACLAAAPAAAAARRLYVPRAGGLSIRPLSGDHVRDAILTGRAARLAEARHGYAPRQAPATGAAPAAAPSMYYARDGYGVQVSIAPDYAPTVGGAQGFVDFLDTRLHGTELGQLRLVIETAADVSRDCGEAALACYDPQIGAMFVPGDQTPATEPSLEYVLTHEYGHHIAAHRSDAPWPALLFGPKYWATAEHVCQGVMDGTYFPGDEGEHYFSNPGEAWAESYAQYHFPDVPWRWAPSLRPGPIAFGAVRHDVEAPWHRPLHARWTATFHRGGRRARTFSLDTLLDGTVHLRLGRASGLRTTMQVLVRGAVVDSAHGTGLTGQTCGARHVRIRVTDRRGSGRIRLRVSYPG